MGRRGASETAIAVLAAFIEKRSWEQSSLARHAGVGVRTLRGVLTELARHGVPLQRRDQNQHEVHWSVPKAWVPNGAILTNAQASACVRILGRTPKSESRDELLRRLMGPAAVALARAEREDASAILAALEDALRDRVALRIVYEGAEGKGAKPRVVSVQHLAYGTRTRFAAVSHPSGRLLWFRVDRVRQAAPTSTEPYRPQDVDDVRHFVAGSVDGFTSGVRTACRFFVVKEAAGWVRGNLPVAGARIEEVSDGIEIEVETAGLLVLARFVVGLGKDACAWSAELADKVRELAEGALGKTALGRIARARRLRSGMARREASSRAHQDEDSISKARISHEQGRVSDGQPALLRPDSELCLKPR